MVICSVINTVVMVDGAHSETAKIRTYRTGRAYGNKQNNLHISIDVKDFLCHPGFTFRKISCSADKAGGFLVCQPLDLWLFEPFCCYVQLTEFYTDLCKRF